MSDETPADPKRLAQANMRVPEIRRFYKEAGVVEAEGGWALALDGRTARTPAKNRLIAPTRAIAERIAAEWAGQGEYLVPAAMPVTRLANSALDGVAARMDETLDEIVNYAGSDLLCYRALEPEALAALQADAFDPPLRWAEDTLGVRFALAAGIVHVPQSPQALAAARAALLAHASPFGLAALHGVTSLTGSALLALALARGAFDAVAVWRAAHVDEDFQISKWGEDWDAAERREARRQEFLAYAAVLAAL